MTVTRCKILILWLMTLINLNRVCQRISFLGPAIPSIKFVRSNYSLDGIPSSRCELPVELAVSLSIKSLHRGGVHPSWAEPGRALLPSSTGGVMWSPHPGFLIDGEGKPHQIYSQFFHSHSAGMFRARVANVVRKIIIHHARKGIRFHVYSMS